jgi:hypothetical protein
MSQSLKKRIHGLIQQVFASYHGAWMVWCDPYGHWLPLLETVSRDNRMGAFTLLQATTRTAGAVGGPLLRRELQQLLDGDESLVLYVPDSADKLGWMWAQALQSERIYDRTLRQQLLDWGWRPQSLTLTDDELAVMARQNLRLDPCDWGGGGLQPNPSSLLEVLAGGSPPDPADLLVLELTAEAAGLPPPDASDLPRWRKRSLARLLVTQVHSLASKLVAEGHEHLIGIGKRRFALELLEQWQDSLRLSKGLPEAILESDRLASLTHPPSEAALKQGPFLSHALERSVFTSTCEKLAQKKGKDLLEALATGTTDLERHAEGFWGDRCTHPEAIPWGELLRLARAARTLLAASSQLEWKNPDDAVLWYSREGWQIDQAGEEILRNLSKPTPELVTLVAPVRSAYRAVWERSMIGWSQTWINADCRIPDLTTAGEWLLSALSANRPTVILVVDALRFDVGATLAKRLNRKEGAERAVVRASRAPLPSITALGMGAAIPIPERELVADIVDGKWQLKQEDRPQNLSEAADRRAWWRAHGKVAEDAICNIEDIQSGNVVGPSTKRIRLVIYDNTLDKLGHDDELQAVGTSAVIDRYIDALTLLQNAGWNRILIVTDHGYIHWPSSEEKNVPPPAPDPAYTNRRAMAYPASTNLKNPQSLAPGGRWRVAFPSGAASFRTYGGLGYFHGGASLQEWVIPCITVEWPSQAQPVGVELQALPHLLTQRPRVTLTVQRGSLLPEDAIAREVDLVIRDAQQRTIIFRSQPVSVTPDLSELSILLEATDDVVAERGTSLVIEVRDRRTEEVISSGPSTLMIEMTGW